MSTDAPAEKTTPPKTTDRALVFGSYIVRGRTVYTKGRRHLQRERACGSQAAAIRHAKRLLKANTPPKKPTSKTSVLE